MLVALREVGEDELASLGVLGQLGGLERGHVEVVVGLLALGVEVGRLADEQVHSPARAPRHRARPSVHDEREGLALAHLSHLFETNGAAIHLDGALALEFANPGPGDTQLGKAAGVELHAERSSRRKP